GIESFQVSKGAANWKQHNNDEDRQPEQGSRQVAPALCGVNNRSQDGQQQPGAGIVDGGAGNRHRSQIRTQKAALLQNTRQDRKRGKADASTDKQSKQQKRNIRTGKFGIERSGQANAQCQGHKDTEITGQNDNVLVIQDFFQVDLESDQKHEQKHPQLAQDSKHHHRRRGKNAAEQAGKEMTKHRRPQDDAYSHLPDNFWLADALEDPAGEPRRQQDGADGNNQGINVHAKCFFVARSVLRVRLHVAPGSSPP